MWLYALVVDPFVAGVLGIAYTVIRAFYYALYTNMTILVLAVTTPNYAIIAYFLISVGYQVYNVW